MKTVITVIFVISGLLLELWFALMAYLTMNEFIATHKSKYLVLTVLNFLAVLIIGLNTARKLNKYPK